MLDPADRILLVRFQFGDKDVWASPGGGIESGESDEQALARELAEECGLRGFELGPCVWTREHWFAEESGWGGQAERHYLLRVPSFEPRPEWTAQELLAEKIVGQRWWTPEELLASGETFAPRRLPELLRDLLQAGLPPEPIDVGV